MGCSASHYPKNTDTFFSVSNNSRKVFYNPSDKSHLDSILRPQDSRSGQLFQSPDYSLTHDLPYPSGEEKTRRRLPLISFLEEVALKLVMNRLVDQPKTKKESVGQPHTEGLVSFVSCSSPPLDHPDSPAKEFLPHDTKKISDISTTEKIITDHQFSPSNTLSRFTSHPGGAQESVAAHRNILTCRLKKFTNISNTYQISSQVLGTGTFLVHLALSQANRIKRRAVCCCVGISGVVRVATHIATRRQYAIKTLSWEGVNGKRIAMLHNEVSIYLKLDHPNIARLIEVYESERSIHLVMELCTGGELYDRLAAKKKYNESDAAKVTHQMLSAINYCHQHHICHRDLKLENWVYSDESPNAPLKLIDFGFSRIFNPGVPMTAMHGTVYYVSPEVMDGCYKETCDIWSIGVIVYMLLSGSPPFNGTHDHEILIKIKRGMYSFSGPQWKGISEEAKSFIRYLLQKDSDKRPSAEEALKHPWLQQRNAVEHDIDLSVVKSMRDFALANILRRAALGVVALGMTSQEVTDLESAFRNLDKSKKGTIHLHDLVKVLCEKLNVEKSEAHYIFDRIDQTGKQEVHYTEFIAATLQAKFIMDDRLIKEAFQRFDVENKQRITLENLRSIIGDSFNGTRVEYILELCDTNHDGYLDYDEVGKHIFMWIQFYKALTSNEVVLNTPSLPVLDHEKLSSTPASADPQVGKEASKSLLSPTAGPAQKYKRSTSSSASPTGSLGQQNSQAMDYGVDTPAHSHPRTQHKRHLMPQEQTAYNILHSIQSLSPNAFSDWYSVEDFNAEFLKLLDEEINHVKHFFQQQFQLLGDHLQHVQEDLDDLERKEHKNLPLHMSRREEPLGNFKRDSSGAVMTTKSLSYSNSFSFRDLTSTLPATLNDTKNNPDRYRLESVVVGIWDMANRLEDFVQLNGVALYKILKKRDKILGLQRLTKDLQEKRKVLSHLTIPNAFRNSLIQVFQQCNGKACLYKSNAHQPVDDATVLDYINEIEFLVHQYYSTKPIRSCWMFFFWGCFVVLLLDLVLVAVCFTPAQPELCREILLQVFPIFRFTLMLCLMVLGVALVMRIFEYYGINYKSVVWLTFTLAVLSPVLCVRFLLDLNPKNSITSLNVFRFASFLFAFWIFFLGCFIVDVQFSLLLLPSNLWIYPFLLCFTYMCLAFLPSTTLSLDDRQKLLGQLGRTLKSGFFFTGRVTLTDNIIGDILTSIPKPVLDGCYTCFFFLSLMIDPGDLSRLVRLRHSPSIILLVTFLPYWIRFVQCLKRFLQEKHSSILHLCNMGKYLSTILVIFTTWIHWDHLNLSIYISRLLFVLVYLFASLYNLIWDCTIDWGLLPDPDNFIRANHRILYPQWLYYFISIINLFGRLLWVLTLIPVDMINDKKLNREVILLVISSLEIVRRTAWVILRLENEHLTNSSQYRAMLWVPRLVSHDAL